MDRIARLVKVSAVLLLISAVVIVLPVWRGDIQAFGPWYASYFASFASPAGRAVPSLFGFATATAILLAMGDPDWRPAIWVWGTITAATFLAQQVLHAISTLRIATGG